MARKFLDYDPWTGIATYTEDHDERMAIHQETDVEPLIEALKTRRIEGFSDRGIAGHIKHYASLDCVTIMNLKKKGIDIFKPWTPDQKRRFMQEIEANYPYLKATEMKGYRPKGQETVAKVIREK